MLKSIKYANWSNLVKIKKMPNNPRWLGFAQGTIENTEKAAFKHKKIIGNTSAFICQNNQTPSCDETNQKDPIIVDQTKGASNW